MNRYSLEEAQAMARRDKRRMLVLGVGALLIGAVYVLAPSFSGAPNDGALPNTGLPVPVVADLPIEPLPFEETAALESIQDGTETARLSLDQEALVPAFSYARKQNAQLFTALGIQPLDRARQEELAASPGAHRLQALRVRGEVVDVERRRREGGNRDDWLVTLRASDGLYSHALFASPPAKPSVDRALEADGSNAVAVGDQLRVDGLFFKLYRREIGDKWVDAPLLLSHHAIATQPPIDAATARVAPALAEVVDDDVGDIHDRDQAALWQLMARAQMLADEVNWDDVPEVDSARLALIYGDGGLFRGTPVKFPISRNMGSWTETAPENPLGLNTVSKGWIGNVTWRPPVGVVQWIAPIDVPVLTEWNDPEQAQFVQARGWFFRNEVYTRASGEPGRAPLFVLASVEPFVPPTDNVTAILLWFVFALTAVFIVAVFFLLRSDRKKSVELQESLVRRRRARREQGTLSTQS
ncbi:MAG: hypothetical protein R3F49_04660 [Planctomycetota bacterium]